MRPGYFCKNINPRDSERLIFLAVNFFSQKPGRWLQVSVEGREVRNNVPLSVVGILSELLLFILRASWLCDVERDKALHQNAELICLVVVYCNTQSVVGAPCRTKHTATPFHKN